MIWCKACCSGRLKALPDSRLDGCHSQWPQVFRIKQSGKHGPQLLGHPRVYTGEKNTYMCWTWENPHQKIKTSFIPDNSHWRETVCTECLQAFRQKSEVITNQKIHTAEQSHGYSIWRESFARKSHLQLHHLTHTGEKPRPTYELIARRLSLTGQIRRHLRMLILKADGCSDCAKASIRLPWQPDPRSSGHQSIHTPEKNHVFFPKC